MGTAVVHTLHFDARRFFAASGRLLSFAAAAFMCVAGLHGAAHGHECQGQECDAPDHHDDAPQECYAFHLVAETPAAPPSSPPADLSPTDIPGERLETDGRNIGRLAAERRPPPRAPPLRPIAT